MLHCGYSLRGTDIYRYRSEGEKLDVDASFYFISVENLDCGIELVCVPLPHPPYKKQAPLIPVPITQIKI